MPRFRDDVASFVRSERAESYRKRDKRRAGRTHRPSHFYISIAIFTWQLLFFTGGFVGIIALASITLNPWWVLLFIPWFFCVRYGMRFQSFYDKKYGY